MNKIDTAITITINEVFDDRFGNTYGLQVNLQDYLQKKYSNKTIVAEFKNALHSLTMENTNGYYTAFVKLFGNKVPVMFYDKEYIYMYKYGYSAVRNPSQEILSQITDEDARNVISAVYLQSDAYKHFTSL